MLFGSTTQIKKNNENLFGITSSHSGYETPKI